MDCWYIFSRFIYKYCFCCMGSNPDPPRTKNGYAKIEKKENNNSTVIHKKVDF